MAPQGSALRFAAFLAAGDALAAIEAAAPSVGLDFSADGLRRLARMLAPDYAGDPLAYSEAPDAKLRELFRFNDPEGTVPPAEVRPYRRLVVAPTACRTCIRADGRRLADGRPRLDRWVPASGELDAYRDTVDRLLRYRRGATAAVNRVAGPLRGLYRTWSRPWPGRRAAGGSSSSGAAPSRSSVEHRRRRHHAGEPARVARLLRRREARVGHRLQRRGGRRDPRAAPRRATEYARRPPPRERRARDLLRVQRRPGCLPPLSLARRRRAADRAIDRAFWEKYQAMAAGQALDPCSVSRTGGTSRRSALDRPARLDAEVLHELPELAGDPDDAVAPRVHRLATASQLGVVAAGEPPARSLRSR